VTPRTTRPEFDQSGADLTQQPGSPSLPASRYVTGKRCENVSPKWAGKGYAEQRCEKVIGHPGLCKTSPDGVHSFSWNPEAVG